MEQSDNEILQQIIELSQLNKNDIILIRKVNKINKHGNQDKRILAITTSFLYLFEKRALLRSLKMSRRFCWEFLKAISQKENNILSLDFGDRVIEFSSKKIDKIISSIVSHVSTIFTNNEMPKITLLRSIKSTKKPKKNRASWRFRFKSLLHDKSVNDDIVGLINKCEFLEVIDFSLFEKFTSYYSEILDSFILFQNSKSINFSDIEISWNVLADFIKTNNNITSIEVNRSINSDFMNFAKAFAGNFESKINSLTFSNNDFGPDFIDGLSIIVTNQKITSLSIRNQLTDAGYKTITPLLMNLNGFLNLKTFDLSGCKTIIPEIILIQLTNLTTLKMNGCSLDLAVLIEDLSKNRHIPLKEVYVSDNFCSDHLNPNFHFSKYINKFVADNVLWHGNSLINFLSILSNQELAFRNSVIFDSKLDVFTISLRNCQITNNKWQELDEFFQNYKCDAIVSLDFSENQIESGFCTFICRSSNLMKLTCDGCFLPNNSKIEIFSKYISNNNTLEELYIRGTDASYLGSSIKFLIESLKENASIKVLDISNNKIGDQVCSLLLDLLLVNSVLTDIYFDLNDINDPFSLRNLIDNLLKEQTNVNIHTPMSDIYKMKISGAITDTEIYDLNMNIKEIAARKKLSNIPSLSPSTPQKNLKANRLKSVENFKLYNSPPPILNPHKRRPRRSSDLIFTENENKISPENQTRIDQVRDEYIFDNQWMSFLNDVPQLDLDKEESELEKEFSYYSLVRFLTTK